MSVLLLRLAGPLQSWGDSSRFARRRTRAEPTKSGVLGLLAAAGGRRRTDPIEDLVGLSFGVRVDQPGRLVRDFQTAIRWRTGAAMPLSYRYYLADAVFLAGVEGDAELLRGLDDAVRSPAFPLYLGRRSCPPLLPLSLGVRDGPLLTELRTVGWQASNWHRRRCGKVAVLDVITDAGAGEADEVVRDAPESWSPERREYGWRGVLRPEPVRLENPAGRDEPDWLAAIGGQ